MLNELYDLSVALKKSNIATKDWHQNFKLLPKGFVFKVLIDKDANISDVIVENVSPSLRKWEKANGFSFPSFNISPLIQVQMESKKMKDLLKRKTPDVKMITNLVRNGTFDWKNEKSRINKCLQGVFEEFSDEIGADIPQEMSGLKELFRRADLISKSQLLASGGCVFLDQLKDVLMKKVIDGQENFEKFAELLFTSDQEQNPKKLNLLLELEDASNFNYPANHPEVQKWINERLLSRTEEPDENSSQQRDAFGTLGIGTDKMPTTKIEILGKVTLRSMSSESPCQQRYQKTDADSFSVGDQTRKDLKAALETITKAEWKDKTWTSFGGKEILIAYPSSLPPMPPAFVGMFGGTNGSESQEGRFSAAVQGVTVAYKSDSSARADNVSVFLLKKPDGYRSKVFNGGTYTAAYILEQAVAWEKAAKNIPFIWIKNWNSDKKPVWSSPKTPYPLEVISCLNTQWVKFGHEANELKRYGAYDAIGLFLNRGQRQSQTASKMLADGLQRWTPLVMGLGQASHQGKILKGPSAWQWGLIPAILGIFLEKLDLDKEAYMLEAVYLVGQALGLADSLHHQYCLKVRKQSLPPQLMGNGLMATALENPRKALALLAQRILPYQAWARTYEGTDAGLSKWFLKKLSDVSANLAHVSWPERMGDADKAQMLFGYLAGVPKEDEMDQVKV